MIAEELLKEKGIPYTISGRDAKIMCLNPEHDDSNPSLSVDRVTGIMNCFSCGFKGSLFRHFGAPKSPVEVKIAMLKDKIQRVRADTVGIQLPADRVEWQGGGYRNISEQTLKIWQAFTWDHDQMAGRIIFPVRDVSGRTVGLVGRSLTQMDGRPKYMNYPHGAALPLIPAKVKPINGRVILVEGIFDALNLWDKGLKNTICCFGTQKVDQTKLSLLKLQGVNGIDIVFDRDDAGAKAAQQIKGLAESMDLSVQVITLPESVDDPGNMIDQQVKGLKKRLYG